MIHQLFVSERLLFTSVNVKPMESSLDVKKATAHHTVLDLLHFTGQDFTAAQRTSRSSSKVTHPPNSHTKDSHSTGITLLFSNSAWVLLRPTELSTFKEL